MTRTELSNLGFSAAELNDVDTAVQALKDSIKASAASYATTKIKAEQDIRPLRAKIQSVRKNAESPVDYLKTEIKPMPLGFDSMSMDVQYFSVDQNDQSGEAHSEHVAAFVSSTVGKLGTTVQKQVSANAQKQTARQFQAQALTGTLVFSVSCTHQNALVLAPLVLHVDKAIRTWNRLFPDPKDKINPTNSAEMIKIAESPDTEGDKKFSILSGVTFGSSFVAMVHIVNTKNTKVMESMQAAAATLQGQMEAGGWLNHMSGGFGVDAKFAEEVKSLLSTQNITSHVTVIAMGIIPSIVSNTVDISVKQFAEFDPAKSMEAIAKLQNATNATQATMGDAASAARTGQKMVSMRGSDIQAALTAVSDIDARQNKILDVNSLMVALDDYLKKVPESKSGIPVNYYLKDITKGMLAEMWVAKYYPGQYMAIQNDDAEVTPKAKL